MDKRVILWCGKFEYLHEFCSFKSGVIATEMLCKLRNFSEATHGPVLETNEDVSYFYIFVNSYDHCADMNPPNNPFAA